MDPARLLSPRLSVVGLLIGTLFLAFSLTPSLLPRPHVMRGVIPGLSLLADYAVDVFGRWLRNYVELPLPGRRVERIVTRIARMRVEG